MAVLKIAVLGSTRGSSMQAILDSINSNELNTRITSVISNRKSATILDRASDNNIPSTFISAKNLSREDYDNKIISYLDNDKPDLILLIGYMKIVSDVLIDRYKNRILNIHPSLLPRHAGLMDLDVHKSVLESNDTKSGCTIHHVTKDVDCGKIVMQLSCDVAENETPESLKAKVQLLEKKAWVKLLKDWENYSEY